MQNVDTYHRRPPDSRTSFVGLMLALIEKPPVACFFQRAAFIPALIAFFTFFGRLESGSVPSDRPFCGRR